MCCVFVCFCSLDLNVKNSVVRFFCLSVQISESIIPIRPDNRGSTVFKIIVDYFIYCVTFTDLLLEKGFIEVKNVRILRCFTN